MNIRSHGNHLIYFTNFSYEVILQSFRSILNRRIIGDIIIKQILFTGVEAVGLISFTAFIIGAIIVIQGQSLFSQFFQHKFLVDVLIITLTRELGSVLTAFIIIARSGTAISTELGNMVINDEVDALHSMNISPIYYLVVPRIYAVILSIIALTIFFNLVGFFGGMVVSSTFYHFSAADFLLYLSTEIELKDIVIAITKSFIFGYCIALISCYHGLRVTKARTEVPIRTSKSVVYSVTSVILLDIIIISIFYVF